MSKGPGLIDVSPDRLAPRPVKGNAAPEEKGKSTAGGRAGKTMIGAYIDKGDVFTIQELLLRLSRERGERLTMQQAIEEALTAYCAKHGVTISGK